MADPDRERDSGGEIAGGITGFFRKLADAVTGRSKDQEEQKPALPPWRQMGGETIEVEGDDRYFLSDMFEEEEVEDEGDDIILFSEPAEEPKEE